MNTQIIAIYDNQRMITRILDFDLLDEVKNKNYKIFSNSFNVGIGENIDAFNDDGTKLQNSRLLKMGLLKLGDDKKLDGETIVDKTEVEKFRETYDKTLDKNKLEKVIDTDTDIEQGNEYIREKNMLEKYTDKIISKDEYNSWITEQRENEYSSTTDKLNLKLLFDTGLTSKQKSDLQSEIEKERQKIKEKYIKM